MFRKSAAAEAAIAAGTHVGNLKMPVGKHSEKTEGGDAARFDVLVVGAGLGGLYMLHRLRALGMTGGQRFSVLAGDAIPIAVLGAVVAVVAAIGASALMPIGLAGRAEPNPGIDVDPLVLGAGFIGVVVIVVALGALAAWRAERTATRAAGTRSAARPSVIARRLGRWGVRPAGVVGVRFALAVRVRVVVVIGSQPVVEVLDVQDRARAAQIPPAHDRAENLTVDVAGRVAEEHNRRRHPVE